MTVVIAAAEDDYRTFMRGPLLLHRPKGQYEKVTKKAQQVLVGIVGGIGPAAGVRLQELILEHDRHRCKNTTTSGFLADACYTLFMTYSNPQIPNNNRAALGIGPPSVDALVDSSISLKRAGAGTVAFACTTAYTWQQEVSKRADIPVLDILELVAHKIAQNDHQDVGLLDVDGTHAAGVFRKTLERYGIEVIVPTQEEQRKIMAAVADLKSGVSAAEGPLDIIEKLIKTTIERDGVSAIVLGCTEIASVVGSLKFQVPSFDVLDSLAEEILRISVH